MGTAHPVAFVGLWTLMMLAMMGPSVLPAVLVFARSGPAPSPLPAPVRTILFVVGYFLTWAGIGAMVVAGQRTLWPLVAQWNRPIAAATLAAAGIYQMTRWKNLCLTHCRTPLHFFLQHWRAGPAAPLVMGAHHGVYCIGCCAGLMAVLITFGMMSPPWMAAIGAIILVEKLLPGGEKMRFPVGVAMIVAGVAVAAGWTPWAAMDGMEGM